MPLHAIAYTSQARDGLQAADIDRILADATSFNRLAGVTGVLTFDGQRFLQYIEGPADGVGTVFQRITNAGSHTALRVLAREPIAVRHFPRWPMAAQSLAATTTDLIVGARWCEGFQSGSVGFALLLGAWTGRHGQLEPPAVMLGS